MTQVTKNLRCICLYGEIEIWLEEAQATNLKATIVASSTHRFIEVAGQVINTSSIIGIFTPDYMADRTRRKNGQWQCKYSTWHAHKEPCDCWERQQRERKDAETERKIKSAFSENYG
jgi:hypothetical protein